MLRRLAQVAQPAGLCLSLGMRSFFIKFNVMWLGGLFFLMLFFSALQHALIWSTKYLDGILVGVVMMGLLLLALLSWCYALWKSWRLTKSDKVINAQRMAVFGYLLGAPVFLKFTGIYWLSAMRLITDKLVHVI